MSKGESNDAKKAVALAAAADGWGVSAAGLEVADITETLPWCRRFTVFLVQRRDRKRSTVAVDSKGTVLTFADRPGTPPETSRAARLGALNSLLAGEAVELPSGITPVLLAEAIHTFLVEPAGFVGSKAFLARETAAPPPPKKRRPIDNWVHLAPHLPNPKNRSEDERRALFEQHNGDPELSRTDAGWALEFSFFTVAGGVERWHVEGTSRDVARARHEDALEPGTFMPPYG